MGKASRSKRRSTVTSVRRTRTSTGWYVITAVVVVLGVIAIVVTRGDQEAAVGVQFGDHWHAALGVYACDHWVDDGQGDAGTWVWPYATAQGSPGRADGTYAGLHSHEDGIVHMEPAASEETGTDANVGKYFEYGDWELDATSFTFLGQSKKNGDKCGDQAGRLHWSVNGKEQQGNPARYVLENDDVVVVAFLPDGKKLSDLGEPPSVKNLAGAANREGGSPGQMPTIPTTAPPDGSTSTTTGDASTTSSSP
jgi:hypothetical protein